MNKKLKAVLSDRKVSEANYYKQIDELIGEEIEYYGSLVRVEQVFKYVKWEHYYKWYTITDEQTDRFNNILKKTAPSMKPLAYWEINFPNIKAIYIVNFLDKKEDDDENKYMYADTQSFAHSEEIKTKEGE